MMNGQRINGSLTRICPPVGFPVTDSNGVLLYCRPDGDPIPSALLPPDTSFGTGGEVQLFGELFRGDAEQDRGEPEGEE